MFDEAEFAKQQIVRLCERALQEAGVAGVFPTPLDVVAELVGIGETLDINELPDEPTLRRPKAFGKLLGALHFRSRTAFIDFSQIEGRVRWTKGHELTHGLVPWHQTTVLFDDEERLFRDTEDQREREANTGAAHLLFQGNRFVERAMSYQTSVKTPILMAAEVGASMHATIWYYVEHHPQAVALAVAGRHPRADGHVPIFKTVESKAFRERFGDFRSRLPPQGLPVAAGAGPTDLTAAIAQAKLSVGAVETELTISDKSSDRGVPMRAELFHNQRSTFLMVTPRRRVRLGQRVELEAANAG